MPKGTKWSPEQRRKFMHTLKAKGLMANANTKEETQVAYLVGRIQGFIEAYSEGHGLDKSVLAERVGAALRRGESR